MCSFSSSVVVVSALLTLTTAAVSLQTQLPTLETDRAHSDELRSILEEGRRLADEGLIGQAVRTLVDAARAADQRGDVEATVTLLEEAIALSGSTDLRSSLGSVLIAGARFEAAEVVLQELYREGHRTPAFLVDYGTALWENGDAEKARAIYEEASAATRRHPGILHQIARLSLWEGRYDEALQLLDEIKALRGESFELEFDRARALEGLSQSGDETVMRSAIDSYRRVLALRPESHHARYNLGRLLARAGETEAAKAELEAFRDAFERFKLDEHEEARELAEVEHALELVTSGRAQEAIEQLSRLTRRPDVLRAVARARLALGDREAAVAALREAVGKDPSRGDLAAQLARLELEGDGSG